MGYFASFLGLGLRVSWFGHVGVAFTLVFGYGLADQLLAKRMWMMRGRWPFRIYRFVGGHRLGSGVKARFQMYKGGGDGEWNIINT